MQGVVDFINRYLTVMGVPGTRLLGVAILITLAVIFKRLFSQVILKHLGRWAGKLETDLDDAFVDQLDRPIGWIILLGGIWLAYMSIVGFLSPELSDVMQRLLSFGFVLVLAVIVHRASVGLAELLRILALRTQTEVDNLIVPYIPKFVEIAAILVVLLKGAEIFLGMSATALVGLLGGAGLTLGLILKDVASDWLASVFIFADHLYRDGDVIELGDGELGIVESVGLRSTAVRLLSGPVTRMTNSQVLSAGVRNWSQARNWRVDFDLRIDGISTARLRPLLEGLREILTQEGLEDGIVYLAQVEGNTRVIKVEYYPVGKSFYSLGQLDVFRYVEHYCHAIERVNLDILALLEAQEIDPLAYTLFKRVGSARAVQRDA